MIPADKVPGSEQLLVLVVASTSGLSGDTDSTFVGVDAEVMSITGSLAVPPTVIGAVPLTL